MMAWSVEGISRVRVIGALVATAPGRQMQEPGFAEVLFDSSSADRLHQVYVDGRWAGCTLQPAERSLRVPVPDDGPAVVVVVAVESADRLTDFAVQLAALIDASPSQATVSWSGGRYLGDGLQHFEIYARRVGATAPADSRPLNGEPIPPTIDGLALSGWGRGGFSRGGFGRSAMRFSMTTPRLPPGDYLLDVAAVDEAGRRTLATVAVTLRGYVRPPQRLHVQSYEAATRSVRLAWQGSEDFGYQEE